jgi:hypothetical protein
MRRRRQLAAAASAACVLAFPAIARAVVATLTNPADPTAVKSCPGTATVPCTVVSRTTAMQVAVGAAHRPMRVTTAGRIVGWQISLSAPTISQIKYFDRTEGGPAEAEVAVLQNERGLDYRLVAVGPTVHLTPYFGHSATFPLETSIPVSPGEIIALAVPTWAPALELRAGRRTAWRASRPATGCTSVATQTVQDRAGTLATYGCLYQTALLSFGAVEISTP